MRELSLFTGAGGGILGTHLLGWTPIGYVEWDDYCQRVLAARIADGLIPCAPIFGDVRQFVESGAAGQYRGFADVVTAGFPCQPFSVAGRKLGADDERNMWPATRDVIRDVRPQHILLENVPGLLSCGYAGTVIGDLAAMGYVGRWGCISAENTGALHERLRWWVVSHAEHGGQREFLQPQREFGSGAPSDAWRDGEIQTVADAERFRLQEPRRADSTVSAEANGVWKANYAFDAGRWPAEPDVGRVANGVANRVDRLRATGNGQVPRVVAAAWRLLA